jgi:hypothetical protein
MQHPRGSPGSFLKSLALGATFVATIPLDETGAGEGLDAAEASAFAASDAGDSGSIVVRHYTDDVGRSAIEGSEPPTLRAGTYVTLPSEIPVGASQESVEQLLEIEAGKGANYVDFEVPKSALGMPENGPVTSSGAWQRILLDPTGLNGAGFSP